MEKTTMRKELENVSFSGRIPAVDYFIRHTISEIRGRVSKEMYFILKLSGLQGWQILLTW